MRAPRADVPSGGTISPETDILAAFVFAGVVSGPPPVASAVALTWDTAEAGAPIGVAPIRVAMTSAQIAGVNIVKNEMAANFLRFE